MTIEQCITAWLDEKYSSSQSAKTRAAYHETLHAFRAMLQTRELDLGAASSAIFPLAQGWAGQSSSPRRAGVSAATFNQRLAILSSFYEYAIRADVLERNPIYRVKRRKLGAKDAARPMQPASVKQGLQHIDRTTPEGLRDYALLSVALATGRRVHELASMRYRDLQLVGSRCHVNWPRCKGGKVMEDLLETKTTAALYAYLHAVYGKELASLPGEAPIWLSFSRRNGRQAIGARTISNICEQHLGTSKVHATRHTTALSMHKGGATLQQVGRQLGHSNLKVTSDYLAELAGYENPLAGELETLFGI